MRFASRTFKLAAPAGISNPRCSKEYLRRKQKIIRKTRQRRKSRQKRQRRQRTRKTHYFLEGGNTLDRNIPPYARRVNPVIWEE